MLDTNTVTYLVNGRLPHTQNRFIELEKSARLAISAVTEGEVRFGLTQRPEAHQLRRNVNDFLAKIEVMPWDSEVAAPYGRLRASLEAAGRYPGPLDMMIAGHAFTLGAVLVTHDSALKRLTSFLDLEDWHDLQ